MPTQSRKGKGIALDTNFLVAIESKGVDVFSQARELFGEGTEFFVTRRVKEELLGLRESGEKMRRAVAVALEVLQRESVGMLETGAGSADESLVEAARKGFAVATLDRVLRKRIKGVGGSVIYLRQNRLLKAG